jgi:hypothetical protein
MAQQRQSQAAGCCWAITEQAPPPRVAARSAPPGRTPGCASATAASAGSSSRALQTATHPHAPSTTSVQPPGPLPTPLPAAVAGATAATATGGSQPAAPVAPVTSPSCCSSRTPPATLQNDGCRSASPARGPPLPAPNAGHSPGCVQAASSPRSQAHRAPSSVATTTTPAHAPAPKQHAAGALSHNSAANGVPAPTDAPAARSMLLLLLLLPVLLPPLLLPQLPTSQTTTRPRPGNPCSRRACSGGAATGRYAIATSLDPQQAATLSFAPLARAGGKATADARRPASSSGHSSMRALQVSSSGPRAAGC